MFGKHRRACSRTLSVPVVLPMPNDSPLGHHKDAILDRLARHANVAQFVSFAPGGSQRYAWIHGHEPNVRFGSPEAAVEGLLAAAPESSVNVRSFEPHDPKSREFILRTQKRRRRCVERPPLGRAGSFTIVNETVDVNDGGVSGVAHGDVLEFAPGDTPRAVEKQGTAALPRSLAYRAFETIYGFRPSLSENLEVRVEFSIHPLRRGYQHGHTIVWEEEHLPAAPREAYVGWPNLFSRMLGDKAYGLLVGWLVGLRVPSTVVIARRLAPFSFGDATGTSERWLRTAPTEQMPGKFTTTRGWVDPYRLMQDRGPRAQIDCVGARAKRRRCSVVRRVVVAAGWWSADRGDVGVRRRIHGW